MSSLSFVRAAALHFILPQISNRGDEEYPCLLAGVGHRWSEDGCNKPSH